MDLRTQQQAEEEANHRKVRSGVGLTLIALGVAGVIWIVERLLALGSGPQDIPLIARFVSFDSAARTIVTSSGSYELPEGVYFASGVLVYLMALGIIAALSKALITSGAGLVGNEVAAALNRLREETARLKDRIESTNK